MKKSKKSKKLKNLTTLELECVIDILVNTADALADILRNKYQAEEKIKVATTEKELKDRLANLSKEDLKKELTEIVTNCFDFEPKQLKKVLKPYIKEINEIKKLENTLQIFDETEDETEEDETEETKTEETKTETV